MFLSVCMCECVCVDAGPVCSCVAKIHRSPDFVILFHHYLLNQERSIIPRADVKNINVSIAPLRWLISRRAFGRQRIAYHRFKKLLICGGDFSTVECAIDAASL